MIEFNLIFKSFIFNFIQFKYFLKSNLLKLIILYGITMTTIFEISLTSSISQNFYEWRTTSSSQKRKRTKKRKEKNRSNRSLPSNQNSRIYLYNKSAFYEASKLQTTVKQSKLNIKKNNILLFQQSKCIFNICINTLFDYNLSNNHTKL